MGMFDEIVVKMKLPGYPKGKDLGSFQTKDLECAMFLYEIDARGRLWLTRHGKRRRPINATLGIRFYGGWHEWVALVKRGRVIHVERVE